MAEKISLDLDHREPLRLAEALRQQPIVDNVCRMELELGDIRHGDLVIERKTYRDFVQSVHSGHLHDQVARLLREVRWPILIVHKAQGEVLTMEGINLVVRHSFTLNLTLPVYRLSKEEDVAPLVVKLCRMADAGELGVFRQPVVIMKEATPLITWYASLPSIGQERAKALARKFPKPIEFIRAVEQSARFEKAKWKTLKRWRQERWTSGLKGLEGSSAVFDEVSQFILGGVWK